MLTRGGHIGVAACTVQLLEQWTLWTPSPDWTQQQPPETPAPWDAFWSHGEVLLIEELHMWSSRESRRGLRRLQSVGGAQRVNEEESLLFVSPGCLCERAGAHWKVKTQEVKELH